MMFRQIYMFRNLKDNVLRFIELKSGQLQNWAWDQRFSKYRDDETWIEGYNKHKKDYDKWKEERCPHN